MRKKVIKISQYLCYVAIFITSIGINDCKTKWYQPKEPEGLEEFLKNHRR